MSDSNPTYVLGRSDQEHRRLQEQAALLRPMTERFFRAAGLSPGMRVLDITAPGTWLSSPPRSSARPARWSASTWTDGRSRPPATGPGGLPSRRSRSSRATCGTLPLEGHFDAVVGRLVLLYMANPAEGLAGVSARVRSGGLVAFQELDMDRNVRARTFPADEDALWNQTGQAIVETFARSGVHARMGRKLMQTFLDAGLPEPRFMDEAAIGGGPDTSAIRGWPTPWPAWRRWPPSSVSTTQPPTAWRRGSATTRWRGACWCGRRRWSAPGQPGPERGQRRSQLVPTDAAGTAATSVPQFRGGPPARCRRDRTGSAPDHWGAAVPGRHADRRPRRRMRVFGAGDARHRPGSAAAAGMPHPSGRRNTSCAMVSAGSGRQRRDARRLVRDHRPAGRGPASRSPRRR